MVDNFAAEVEALRAEIAATLTEAVTIATDMGRYAGREWDQFLHRTDAGRVINQVGYYAKGAWSEAGEFVEGVWDISSVRIMLDAIGVRSEKSLIRCEPCRLRIPRRLLANDECAPHSFGSSNELSSDAPPTCAAVSSREVNQFRGPDRTTVASTSRQSLDIHRWPRSARRGKATGRRGAVRMTASPRRRWPARLAG
ncbi:hypothetical protein MSAS_42330 [Mycobacterium saskatchewanense]|uniref:Uncharacterized protein n=1 Tax=Mycobacterium saskatchewanense TaxID=220927 RepID=A0AAJ3NK45_9MYCO|nr:hypothetical protein [Mycobacterium saskatchewanense]ORW63897.1 hypothetical protein AWC23_26940 [Mycobacterium saskatchewanense]BBX65059.1 hypothetical protein MSAS_42330 [Mycobacterium saskatchewanense]